MGGVGGWVLFDLLFALIGVTDPGASPAEGGPSLALPRLAGLRLFITKIGLSDVEISRFGGKPTRAGVSQDVKWELSQGSSSAAKASPTWLPRRSRRRTDSKISVTRRVTDRRR